MGQELDGEELERVRAAVAASPRAMTVLLVRVLWVPVVVVVAALQAGRAVELDGDRWEQIVRCFEELGDVHVIVTNGSVTLEAFGRFGGFSNFGEGERRYFNVQSKSLDMHIRPATIGRVYAVRKPGHLDGVETLSVQFFHREGFAAFKVFLTFGGSAPPARRVEQFEALVARFAAAK
jgi:putative heme iron utilization protein